MDSPDNNPNVHQVVLHKVKKPWFKRVWVWVLIVIGVFIVLGAIGASNGTSTNSNTNNSSLQPSTSSKTNTIAKVGDTINIGGSKGLAVTLLKITDPAQGSNQYMTADVGERFVAASVKIMNNETSSYQDDANNNITLIGSDNQSYTAYISEVSGCTNFRNGHYTLAAGESATGCVVFQVPNTVKTVKIQFQTGSGTSGDTGEWTVQ